MRETVASGWIVQNSPSARTRGLRFGVIALGVIALGIAVAMTSGAARAADDDNEKSFSDRFIDSFKTTIRGGTSIDDGTIEYRERSPLVVPPRLDLPPPDTSSKEVKASNWPKDPDEGRRRATAAAKKKSAPATASAFDPFNPFKRDASAGGSTPTADAEPPPPSAPPRPDNPTAQGDPIYDRPGDLFTNNVVASTLGFSGFGSLGGLFGGNKSESATFKSEPAREALTQPPTGYQTPSPNFAYGLGPNEWMKREAHPDDIARAKRTAQ